MIAVIYTSFADTSEYITWFFESKVGNGGDLVFSNYSGIFYIAEEYLGVQTPVSRKFNLNYPDMFMLIPHLRHDSSAITFGTDSYSRIITFRKEIDFHPSLFHEILSQFSLNDDQGFYPTNVLYECIGMTDTTCTLRLSPPVSKPHSVDSVSSLILFGPDNQYVQFKINNGDVLENYTVTGEWNNASHTSFNVRLSGSQQGVLYQLTWASRFPTTVVSNIIESSIRGTGEPLVFENITKKGVYKIAVVHMDGTRTEMEGSADMFNSEDMLVSNSNYTRTRRYLDASGTQYTESAVHYDGLGRAIQEVAVGAGGGGEDILRLIEYDHMGRSDTKTYLPYPRPSLGFRMSAYATSEQSAWYDAQFSEKNSYTEGHLANIRRVYTGTTVTEYTPGSRTQKYPVRMETYPNDGNEVIQRYVLDGTVLQYTGLYSAGTLTVQKTSQLNLPADQQSESYIYTNSLGQVVAEETRAGGERRITAYVYDEMGRQRYVIPPIQYDQLLLTGVTIALTDLRRYCYYTEYDDHGRIIKQYVPGADPSRIVYDRRGRVALTQDGRQSADNQWTFTKYDNLDRPVLTGLLTGGDYNTHWTALQNQSAFGETRGTALHGYTNQTYPQAVTQADILTVLYYDDYTWIDDPQYAFSSADALDSGVDTENVVDLPTGTKTKVLGISGDEWLTSVTYYNSKYRSIQSISGLYPAGIEIVSNLHNFTGDVTQTKVSQTVGGQTYGYNKWFDYDETGRLQNIRQQMVGESTPVTLVSYTYDGLGNVSEKKIHNGLETTSHTYDIAGRQTKVSSPSFSYDLWFDKSPSGQSARHDGQLSQVTWGNNAAGDQKGYTFTYDPFKQLSSALFLQPSGTLWNATSQYAEGGPTGAGSPIGYDRNGNILSLTRTDEFGTARLRLAYHYDHPVNGNALTSVTLNDVPSSAFEYDRNGNMTFDGQTSVRIAYNLLNLPEKVSANGNEATYIYSADGAKLATIAPNGSRTYYRSVFTYAKEPNQPEALLYAMHPEGIVTRTNTSWEYKYFKRDHVGSTRVLLAARNNQLVTEQQTDYYPFGLTHGGFNNLHLNRYLYGGKEYQDVALGGTVLGLYDFHARYYNPLLGRWFNPDPANQTTNPYLYCGNSPLMYTDPDGRMAWFVPIIMGAALGAYSGGTIANEGQYNPVKWNYSSGQTWRYMAGGAVVGGVSTHLGTTIAAGGGALANTAAMMSASFTYSTGTFMYTGGKTPVSMSFGVASYDFTNNEWGYFGKKGNKWYQNLGYGLGALANLSDILAGLKPGEVQLRTENDPEYYKSVDAESNPIYQKDLIGHSQIVDSKGNPLIDWGPAPGTGGVSGFGDWVAGTNAYENGLPIPTSKMKWDPITIKGVNSKTVNWYKGILNKGGSYNLAINSCVSQTSRALNLSGIFNIGIHPYLLNAQMYLWSNGFRPWTFSHLLTQ